ncbi:MAG: hypothetical protein JNJ73_05835 [Hyphomonadaceae bacterium]|nr:hypothetical protein [Hyphomonadaceae bacterium]
MAQAFLDGMSRLMGAVMMAVAGVFAMFLLLFATLAVTCVGALMAAVSVAMRLARVARPPRRGAPVLEARRTPDGWTVEPLPRT